MKIKVLILAHPIIIKHPYVENPSQITMLYKSQNIIKLQIIIIMGLKLSYKINYKSNGS
jgi:hypothetical protein